MFGGVSEAHSTREIQTSHVRQFKLTIKEITQPKTNMEKNGLNYYLVCKSQL